MPGVRRTRHNNSPSFALVALVLTLALPSIPTSSSPSARLPLRHTADVRLPGSPSRFDYQAVDPTRRRIYVAHLGANQLDVVDLDHLTAVGAVDHVANVHGVQAAPDLDLVYASATGADEVIAIDTTTLEVRFRVPSGDFPDGLAYDPTDSRVFVSNKNNGTITALDAQTGQLTQIIKLSRETGNVVYDAVDPAAFAAVRPPDELVRVDPSNGAITARTRLRGCNGAHGLYIEARVRLAFVACERNARLAVVDLMTMRQSSLAKVGNNPDVLAYDNELRRLYVASESGIVSVFELRASCLAELGRARLAAHAHSVAVDQATHHVFFPIQDIDGHPVLRVMRPTESRFAV
jgi:DNA-binding beta-propeller fold protein YncE